MSHFIRLLCLLFAGILALITVGVGITKRGESVIPYRYIGN